MIVEVLKVSYITVVLHRVSIAYRFCMFCTPPNLFMESAVGAVLGNTVWYYHCFYLRMNTVL
jgi:hypothetical protein